MHVELRLDMPKASQELNMLLHHPVDRLIIDPCLAPYSLPLHTDPHME